MWHRAYSNFISYVCTPLHSSVECVCIVLCSFTSEWSLGSVAMLFPTCVPVSWLWFLCKILSPLVYLIRNWTRLPYTNLTLLPQGFLYRYLLLSCYSITDICLFCSLPLDFRRKSEPHINFLSIMLAWHRAWLKRCFWNECIWIIFSSGYSNDFRSCKVLTSLNYYKSCYLNRAFSFLLWLAFVLLCRSMKYAWRCITLHGHLERQMDSTQGLVWMSNLLGSNIYYQVIFTGLAYDLLLGRTLRHLLSLFSEAILNLLRSLHCSFQRLCLH